MSSLRTMTPVRTLKAETRRRTPAPQVKRRVASARKPSRRRTRMTPELKALVWILSAALLLVGVLLYPFQLCVVPAWSVQVVDENDHPLPGVAVQQEWGQFGPQQMTWADSRVTGADGRVVFPERDVASPLGPRALTNFLASGLQPGDGKDPLAPSSHLFICRQGKSGEVTWQRGMGEPQDRLVVHKGFCQYSPQGI